MCTQNHCFVDGKATDCKATDLFQFDFNLTMYSQDKILKLIFGVNSHKTKTIENVVIGEYYTKKWVTFIHDLETNYIDNHSIAENNHDTNLLSLIDTVKAFGAEKNIFSIHRKSSNLEQTMSNTEGNGVCGYIGAYQLVSRHQLKSSRPLISNKELNAFTVSCDPYNDITNSMSTKAKQLKEFKYYINTTIDNYLQRKPSNDVRDRITKASQYICNEDKDIHLESEAWFSDNILFGDHDCKNGWFYNHHTLQNIVNVSLLKFKKNDNNDSYGVFIGTNIYQYTGELEVSIFKYGTAEAILSNGNYLVHKCNHFGVEPYYDTSEDMKRFNEAVNDLINQLYSILRLYHNHKYPTYIKKLVYHFSISYISIRRPERSRIVYTNFFYISLIFMIMV